MCLSVLKWEKLTYNSSLFFHLHVLRLAVHVYTVDVVLGKEHEVTTNTGHMAFLAFSFVFNEHLE